LGLALALLAGCGTTNLHSAAIDEADRGAATAFANCDAQRASGALRSYRQVVACARPPVLMGYAQAGFPFMDLVLFDLQERDVAASRLDDGNVRPADVQRDLAVLDQRLMAERERRVAARTGIGGAVPTSSPQQLVAGLPTLQDRALPAQDNACFTVGDFKRCNSDNSDSTN
jgi:hypothetical protein